MDGRIDGGMESEDGERGRGEEGEGGRGEDCQLFSRVLLSSLSTMISVALAKRGCCNRDLARETKMESEDGEGG